MPGSVGQACGSRYVLLAWAYGFSPGAGVGAGVGFSGSVGSVGSVGAVGSVGSSTVRPTAWQYAWANAHTTIGTATSSPTPMQTAPMSRVSRDKASRAMRRSQFAAARFVAASRPWPSAAARGRKLHRGASTTKATNPPRMNQAAGSA
ncbi:hypothetical protein EAW56_12055 [Corynebacterium gottingense]|uniref:Uncharacterized protein n=1 Tax=Corynebacterium gottingense TaxID=2041036 RepID=A0ABX9UGI1_9CORY|nr:hypothetical protein EAW56_12055 [Corynebacterium gottingense]